MTIDRYAALADDVRSPARRPFAILPSDTVELADLPKAIYVGTAGNVTLRGADAGADVLFKAVPAGTILDVRARFVRATGTTAADLVGLA